jgi:hypothetical protein
MRGRGPHGRSVLFHGVMALLWVPLLQQHLGVVREQPLRGFIPPVERPHFTARAFWVGGFQQQYEAWQNERFGFRNTLVRIHNQIAYSLYGRSVAREVVIGQDGYLFAQAYVDAVSGRDFVGEEKIRERLEKARRLQDALAQRGITLLLVLAPGKGSFFEEYVPPGSATAVGPTNYEVYARLMRELDLQHLDLHRWFLEEKRRSPYPLFPKYGIHWSRYGAQRAADLICRRLSVLRGRTVPGIRLDRVVLVPRAMDENEYDLRHAMNLLAPPPPTVSAYGFSSFETPAETERPAMLAVADSYFWGLMRVGLHRGFRKIDFLYYNKELYPDGQIHAKKSRSEIGYEELIRARDVVLIVCTDANLSDFGWGFIEDGYEQLVARPQAAVGGS